jgi:spermidine synthase
VYGDGVRVAVQTGVQEVVLTGTGRSSLDLYLDGRLRVSARDEYRYHEALVHPAMNGPRARVLILGGGDGLAAREVLRYPDVRNVTLVEIDPGVTRLARTDRVLSALNAHAYRDRRLTAVNADAFSWLRAARGGYDVVISDLPDPGISAGTKLYAAEFYGLVADALAPGGRLVVHGGPPVTQPRTYWTVEASMRAAGLHTRPYRISGRLSDFVAGPDRATHRAQTEHGWGFVLARPVGAPALRLAPGAPKLRSLTQVSLMRAGRDAESRRLRGLPPSTLVHPRYWEDR